MEAYIGLILTAFMLPAVCAFLIATIWLQKRIDRNKRDWDKLEEEFSDLIAEIHRPDLHEV